MKAAAAWWVALTLVGVVAPIPLGSIETEWLIPLALAVLTLGALAVVAGPVLRGQELRLPGALIPVVLLCGLVFVQSVPLPRALVALVSPERLTVPAVPAPSSPLTLSLYPGATGEQAILFIAILYLLWGLSSVRGRACARVVAIAGVIHAVLGLVFSETGLSGRIPGSDTTRIAGLYVANEVLTPFGTYVNKNHFAGLMIIGAGGVLAILLRRWRVAVRQVEDLGLRARIAALSGRGFFRLFAPFLGLILILLALFASGSRGAAVALLLAVILVPLMGGVAVRRVRLWPVLAGALLVVAVMLAATGGRSESFLERLVPEGRFLNRPRLWRDVLVMAVRYPAVGIGSGTFEVAFPRYQTVDGSRRFTHAEGDWVQHIAETGLLGTVLLAWFGVLLLRRFLRLYRGGGTTAAFAVGAFTGLAGLLIHGFVDTGLHMPANMVLAAVLTGCLIGRPCLSRKGEQA